MRRWRRASITCCASIFIFYASRLSLHSTAYAHRHAACVAPHARRRRSHSALPRNRGENTAAYHRRGDASQASGAWRVKCYKQTNNAAKIWRSGGIILWLRTQTSALFVVISPRARAAHAAHFCGIAQEIVANLKQHSLLRENARHNAATLRRVVARRITLALALAAGA